MVLDVSTKILRYATTLAQFLPLALITMDYLWPAVLAGLIGADWLNSPGAASRSRATTS